MATATRARRTRAAAPTVQNVQLASGRGVVHRAHSGVDWAFPACRTGNQTGRPTHGRYGHTTTPVDCANCLEAENQIPEPPRQPRRVSRETPRAARARRNGTAQAEAEQQATQIIAEETAAVLVKRGTHADTNDQRKDGCSDEDYALAVQVRELRARGLAWWAIAHQMELKGHGASVKTGKTGAAHARRLWEKAWGATYKDTSVPRETKAIKAERAITQPGKPFFPQEALDREVLDAVKGKEIEWTTRLGAGDTVVCSVQTAIVSPLHKAEVVLGKKGRVLKFYELPEQGSRLSGPLRSVYIDQIEKVGL